MKPIRTQKGKLFGMLDTTSYVLHIKDGAIARLIQIPPAGLTVLYIASSGQQEIIYIPPQSCIITVA